MLQPMGPERSTFAEMIRAPVPSAAERHCAIVAILALHACTPSAMISEVFTTDLEIRSEQGHSISGDKLPRKFVIVAFSVSRLGRNQGR